MATFGAHLLRARTRAHLSQTALARQAALSISQISRLESDHTHVTLRSLKKLSTVLKFPRLTVAQLLACAGDDDGAR